MDIVQPVITETALDEFYAGSFNTAGPTEKFNALLFLLSVEVIPDNPSERVVNLKANTNSLKKKLGPKDKIIFGTGDELGDRHHDRR